MILIWFDIYKYRFANLMHDDISYSVSLVYIEFVLSVLDSY